MNVKSILLFICGVGVGCSAGVLGSKKYFQDKYQKQYDADYKALEEYYHRVDEYERSNYENEEEFEDDGVNPVENDSKPGGRMTAEERATIKEKLNQNWQGSTNYAGMYNKKNSHAADSLDQGEKGEVEAICKNCKSYNDKHGDSYCELLNKFISKDDTCSDFAVIEYTPEEEAFDEHQKNKNKPPKIISAEAYEELPAYVDKEVLYLYAYDEILVHEDNDDEPITEPERLIGDALTKYDFVDNDERIIFVMNYALDTCYEIQKVDAGWGDSH